MTLSNSPENIIETYTWKDIVIGDLIVIKKDDCIPADMVILSSSNSDS